jgi:hypothetical protein
MNSICSWCSVIVDRDVRGLSDVSLPGLAIFQAKSGWPRTNKFEISHTVTEQVDYARISKYKPTCPILVVLVVILNRSSDHEHRTSAVQALRNVTEATVLFLFFSLRVSPAGSVIPGLKAWCCSRTSNLIQFLDQSAPLRRDSRTEPDSLSHDCHWSPSWYVPFTALAVWPAALGQMAS